MAAVAGGQVDREEGGEAAGQHHPQGEAGVETRGHPGRVIRAGHQQILHSYRLSVAMFCKNPPHLCILVYPSDQFDTTIITF